MLESFIKDETSKMCIVIFAHWCPHCKDVIKKIGDMNLRDAPYTMALVNGEAVNSEILATILGKQIEYYPTILSKNGKTGEEVGSVEEATQKISDSAGTSAMSAMKSNDGEMFDSLF